MEKTVLVLDANKNQRIELCELLKEGSYSAIPLHSIQRLEKCIQDSRCLAVFWDIDTVSVDNRTLRELTIKFPGVHFFCLSSHPFHPELQDAICYHIYACINRPVDPDELFFWLRSINENDTEIQYQPES
jgi:DNA-binding NtrC family response regulator